MEGDSILTKHVEVAMRGEKMGYITYLVRSGKITRNTARCLINRHNEVPPESISIIKDLYEKAKYEELNDVCECVTFMEVGNGEKNPFWNKKDHKF